MFLPSGRMRKIIALASAQLGMLYSKNTTTPIIPEQRDSILIQDIYKNDILVNAYKKIQKKYFPEKDIFINLNKKNNHIL